VVIPWGVKESPPASVFSQRSRTRRQAGLEVRDEGCCALVFCKRARRFRPDLILLDLATGNTGAIAVAADLTLERQHEPWLITSGRLELGRYRVDGPHYAPAEAWAEGPCAKVDVSPYIDARQLLAHLHEGVRNPAIRHKGFAPFSYICGRTRPDRVTCSSFIGNAILRQPSSPLARALRRALRERLTYGEISPADLARASAILRLLPEGSSQAIRLRPLLRKAAGA
jgi:hypothetical protein